ncbi:hypothetical protein E3U55_10470 [Filobacillus milosensis]|uniref:Uncharacterized protein n=1 Tax=Filobacillus milosensis TaxID=94137 RepID=A0A4Y8IG39_9BACI|nr:hypothetical protein [Filobacillus milosensis]TFB19577.1 hypothetical protein E3U55_10470 [Filobacillus milosensis]
MMVLVLPAIAVIVGIIPFFFLHKCWVSPLITAMVYIGGSIFFVGENEWAEDLLAAVIDAKFMVSTLVSFIVVWNIESEKNREEYRDI